MTITRETLISSRVNCKTVAQNSWQKLHLSVKQNHCKHIALSSYVNIMAEDGKDLLPWLRMGFIFPVNPIPSLSIADERSLDPSKKSLDGSMS